VSETITWPSGIAAMFALVARVTTIDGRTLTLEDIDEMDADELALWLETVSEVEKERTAAIKQQR
jgi:hypothetical protein